MNNSDFVRRLTLLNAQIPTVEFVARQDEEKDSAAVRAAKIAGIAAGVGAASYGGLSLIRGSRMMKSDYGSGPENLGQAWTATRMGHRANVGDVTGVANRAYGAAGQAGVAAGRSMELPVARLQQSAVNAGRAVGRAYHAAPGVVAGAPLKASLFWKNLQRKAGRGNISRFPLVAR
jgi:hypothetical protein